MPPKGLLLILVEGARISFLPLPSLTEIEKGSNTLCLRFLFFTIDPSLPAGLKELDARRFSSLEGSYLVVIEKGSNRLRLRFLSKCLTADESTFLEGRFCFNLGRN
jgi:hypothetical protein